LKRPLISIIVPNYNHASFLEERLRSIYSQGLDDFELIILDDCSQDHSVQVIRETLEGKTYTLKINQTNSGSPFRQWERGLKLARGKYAWIAESDDSCDSSFLSSLLSPLEQGEASLAYSRTQAIDSSGKPIERSFWPEPLDPTFFSKSQTCRCSDFLHAFMTSRNCIPNASSVIFKIDTINEFVVHEANRVSSTRYTGDWIFWSSLLKNYNREQIFFEANPLCYHRDHSGTTRVAQNKQREKERMAEYSEAIDYIYKLNGSRKASYFLKLIWNQAWRWSYSEYLARYKPNLFERITGSPLRGMHRTGYFFFSLSRLM
jgi:glycosyltransferase involved in cell wall biosynthesis